jgi:hypothetical protein
MSKIPAYRKATAGKKELPVGKQRNPSCKDTKMVNEGMKKFYEKRPHLKPEGKWDRKSNNALFGREDISDE